MEEFAIQLPIIRNYTSEALLASEEITKLLHQDIIT